MTDDEQSMIVKILKIVYRVFTKRLTLSMTWRNDQQKLFLIVHFFMLKINNLLDLKDHLQNGVKLLTLSMIWRNDQQKLFLIVHFYMSVINNWVDLKDHLQRVYRML